MVDLLSTRWSFSMKLILVFTFCRCPLFLSITAASKNFNEKPKREENLVMSNNSARQLDEVIEYKNCPEGFWNRTNGVTVLIEYNYYPGYFLYPR